MQIVDASDRAAVRRLIDRRRAARAEGVVEFPLNKIVL